MDWIFRLRYDINDVEKDWFESDEVLIDYLNDGLCEVFVLRPELYTKPVKVRLQEGDMQCVPDCCRFYGIDSIVDSEGRVIASIRQKKRDDVLDWRGASCLTAGNKNKPGIDREYSIDDMTRSRFYIKPPVKKGQDVYARVNMACKPENLKFDLEQSLDWLDCEIRNPAYAWALYRALSANRESASALAAANLYQKEFFSLLKLRLDTDTRVVKETQPETNKS